MKPAFLSYILYKQSASEKYKSFQIPKKYGGVRLITAPIGAGQDAKGGKPVSQDGSTKFIHLFRSLYAVPTPPVNGRAGSKIEDFFEAALKATVVNGKTFRDENDADNSQHYGKVIFAHKVVKPNAESINFNGFVPLLDNIVGVLKYHYAASEEVQAAAV